jgi:hypothetical protein
LGGAVREDGLSSGEYQRFLESKIKLASPCGFEVAPNEVNPMLKEFVRASIPWLAQGGRRALFSSFGLHKTSAQLELARLARQRGLLPLIVLPLGVRHEFIDQAQEHFRGSYAVDVKFVRTSAEVEATDRRPDGPIYLSNYESVREGKLDPSLFDFASLDEAARLRGFGGTKTFREFMRLFADVRYRFVATATPDPNEYIELLAYAAFLDIMDVGQAKTRFFQRDSEHNDRLTLYPHKEREFWLWVASWALFIRKPSDLGFPDDGYVLPDLDVRWHEVPTDHSAAGAERGGQVRMFRNSAISVTESAKEKRDSLTARIEKLLALRAEDPGAHRIIWHHLEAERAVIEKACAGVASIYGSQELADNERVALDFKYGRIAEIATKPTMSGAGPNWQHHCHWAIFLGIDDKFHDVIQAIHRLYRFGQAHRVRIDIIYSEAERERRARLERRWAQHNAQAERMAKLIREYGLGRVSLASSLARTIGCERREAVGETFRLINNDCVNETAAMDADSVDLTVTSIPFEGQYEYTPSYNDFGHTESSAEFWAQMDFLTPQLLRITKPGRVVAIHVKDRIVPGGLSGFGFQTLTPISDDCVAQFRRHGFAYLGRITIVTDVVRENNQTYRLGWTEQCKDGSRMGVGLPEYLLLFRKPPTDRSNGYADQPVLKSKLWWLDDGSSVALSPFERAEKVKHPTDRTMEPPAGNPYSRARWQIDAHGFYRSDGNRLLTADDLCGADADIIWKMWKGFSQSTAYDYAHHVALSEALDRRGELPKTFMLLPPHSWHPDAWTDVTRMRTLNGAQYAAGRELHICLARDSRVLTKERGYVPIQDVVAGEHALTHMGRWRPVQVIANTGIRPVITVRAQGVPGLTLTPDHQLWVRKSDWVRERDGAEYIEPTWTEAQATLGGYLNQKLPPIEELTNSDLLHWWIVGRWIADGHWDARGGALISCGAHELEQLTAEMKDRSGGKYWTGTAWQVRILDPSGSLKETLRDCGVGAVNKKLPPEAFSLPSTLAGALLAGYLSGDGHHHKDRGRWMVTTVSRDLALGLTFLAQRVHGAVACAYAGRPARVAEIEGRPIQCQQEWAFCFDLPSERRKKPFILEDGAWKKIRSIEDAGKVETWCLRVAEDESFTAEGCIVKNCPLQFDIVDRAIARFSMPGDLVFDPFSGLGTVPYRAIKLKRRGLGVELNTDYWRDAIGYCEAAEQEALVPTLFDLLETDATVQSVEAAE